MNQYFDLHCHSASKTFMTSKNMTDKKSPWEKVRGGIPQLVSPILTSQASFTQVLDGGVRILVVSIVPLERGYTQFWLIRDVVSATTALDRDFIDEINQGKHSFYDLLMDELEFIRKHKEYNGNQLNFLRSAEDLMDDPNTINVLLNIEGSYALDSSDDYEADQNPKYLENLRKVKKIDDISCFYLTLTHLNKLEVCNHAFGAKITTNEIFKPSQGLLGIGKEGIKIIDECYSTANGPRILIDIKHMSLVARQEFYKHRRENGFDNIPIIASHMGVTGFSISTLKDKVDGKVKNKKGYKKVKYKPVRGIGQGGQLETCFNPWSINLYDEEILEIIKSDGLIGVCLDQRILGYDNIKPEYFAKVEWEQINDTDFDLVPDSPFGSFSDTIELEAAHLVTDIDDEEDGTFVSMLDRNSHLRRMTNVEDVTDLDIELAVVVDQFEDTDLSRKKRRHLRILCNNILHIVKVGGDEAWKHICIGSDFDGLINPINNCKNIDEYADLEDQLKSELETMMQEPDANLSLVDDLAGKVRGIMYENGKKFLEKHFSAAAIGLNR